MRSLAVAAALLAFAETPSAAQPSQCAEVRLLGNSGRVHYNPFEPALATDVLLLQVRGTIEGVRGVRFILVDTAFAAEGDKLGNGGPATYEIEWIEDNSAQVLMTGNAQPIESNSVIARINGNHGVDIVRR